MSRGQHHDRLEGAVNSVTDSERLEAMDRVIADLETERQAVVASEQKVSSTSGRRVAAPVVAADPRAITTTPDRGNDHEQRAGHVSGAAGRRQTGNELVGVTALLEQLQAQVAGIAHDRDLRDVLLEERSWLDAAQRTIAEARRWREEEQRRYWPGVATRWITALAFSLLSAVAVGTGYGWIAKPYAIELETLRPREALGLLVEQRMNTMTASERRQLDALMKWKRAAR